MFHPEFIEDLKFWVHTDRKVALRLLTIVQAVLRTPFEGIALPEPLRHRPSGTWSRRLTKEHRVVYVVSDDRVDFLQGRYHY